MRLPKVWWNRLRLFGVKCWVPSFHRFKLVSALLEESSHRNCWIFWFGPFGLECHSKLIVTWRESLEERERRESLEERVRQTRNKTSSNKEETKS